MKKRKTAQSRRNCIAMPNQFQRDLAEQEGRGTLEARKPAERPWNGNEIKISERPPDAKWHQQADEEDRKKCQPGRGMVRLSLGNEQEQNRRADCDERN
jgi:hypothetical protein